MKDLKHLFKEHEGIITANLPEIRTVDLWSEQISFMAEEHPFKAPAVFFGYRMISGDNQSEKLQNLRMQVDVYLFYETFADTSRGSKKQQKALDFLDLMTKINACFHGTNGNYFSEMKRTGFNPVETGGAGILYVQRYELSMLDNSAQVLYVNMKYENMEVEVEKVVVPNPVIDNRLYDDIST